MYLPGGFYYTDTPKRYDWFHLAVNFISPVGGFKVYNNGMEGGSGAINLGGSYSIADGRIAIGRRLTGVDGNYASVEVDELLFFNAALSEEEIMMIKRHTL